MGWVYLDDHFPEHPKAVQAGDMACWLYVCALAYCHRNQTSGVVPRGVVGNLTGSPGGLKLAGRLVDARLWHDMGDHFAVNDYEQWNSKEMARRMRAKRAAETRWGKTAGPFNDHAHDA